MRKLLMLAIPLLAACGICGCGGADGLMRDQIKLMNETAEAIESKAPQEKINELEKRLEENGKKLEELKLSDEEKKKLLEKHNDEMMKAGMRYAKAKMGNMMGDFGKAFQGFPGMPGGAPGAPGIPGFGQMPGMPDAETHKPANNPAAPKK